VSPEQQRIAELEALVARLEELVAEQRPRSRSWEAGGGPGGGGGEELVELVAAAVG
jgi:hypothetical protein